MDQIVESSLIHAITTGLVEARQQCLRDRTNERLSEVLDRNLIIIAGAHGNPPGERGGSAKLLLSRAGLKRWEQWSLSGPEADEVTSEICTM